MNKIFVTMFLAIFSGLICTKSFGSIETFCGDYSGIDIAKATCLDADIISQKKYPIYKMLNSEKLVKLKVIPISTHVADYHKGDNHIHKIKGYGDPKGHEGWAAYVEATYKSGLMKRILFDVGADLKAVLDNAKIMNIDLSQISDVFLSHWHYDHIQTLPGISKLLGPLVFVHVQKSIFNERYIKKPDSFVSKNKFLTGNFMALRNSIDKPTNLRFMVYDKMSALVFADGLNFVSLPGILTTGEVKRLRDEGTYSKKFLLSEDQSGRDVDTVRDDQSLLIEIPGKGMVVVSGCAHSGIRNIVKHTKFLSRVPNVHAIVGGLHLWDTKVTRVAAAKAGQDKENSVEAIAEDLVAEKVDFILAGHCTGANAPHDLKRYMGKTCFQVAQASAGSSFIWGHGKEITTQSGFVIPKGESGLVSGQYSKCNE